MNILSIRPFRKSSFFLIKYFLPMALLMFATAMAPRVAEALPITIDASHLNDTYFSLLDVANNSSTGPFQVERNAPYNSFDLAPGSYAVQQSIGSNLNFTVTAPGTVDYDPSYDTYVIGRGTNTLGLIGLPLTVNTTALTTVSIGGVPSPTLVHEEHCAIDNGDIHATTEGVITVNVLPGVHGFGVTYNTSPGSSISAGVGFELNNDGIITNVGGSPSGVPYAYSPGTGGSTLIVVGYPVTIAATEVPPFVTFFQVDPVGSNNTYSPTTLVGLNLFPNIPHYFYFFNGVNPFQLIANAADGSLSTIPSPAFIAGLPVSVNGDTVLIGYGNCGDGVVSGDEQCDDGNTNCGDGCGNCQIVPAGSVCVDIDSTDLSTPNFLVRSFPANDIVGQGPGLTTLVVSPGTYRYIHLPEFSAFNYFDGVSSVNFTVDGSGHVGFNSSLDGFVDGRGTGTLHLRGWPFAIIDATGGAFNQFSNLLPGDHNLYGDPSPDSIYFTLGSNGMFATTSPDTNPYGYPSAYCGNNFVFGAAACTCTVDSECGAGEACFGICLPTNCSNNSDCLSAGQNFCAKNPGATAGMCATYTPAPECSTDADCASGQVCDQGFCEFSSPAVDTDSDGVADNADNCSKNANAHQEDTDQDGVGDKCDGDTFNPSFEPGSGSDGSGFLASTPLYSAKVDTAGCVKFGEGPGIGGVMDDDPGLSGRDASQDIRLCTSAIDIGNPLTLTAFHNLAQSVWQGVTDTNTSTGGASNVRTHYASGPNALVEGIEIMNLAAVSGDASATWTLNLPSGFSVTTGQLVGGKGKLTIRNGTADVYRLSAVACTSNGKPTAIEDDCPGRTPYAPQDSDPAITDPNPATDFMGFSRMIAELGQDAFPDPSPAGCGQTSPAVGIYQHDGSTAENIKLRQEAHENEADHATGTWSVVQAPGGGVTLTATCDASFVAKNQLNSSRMGMGWAISSLASSSLPTTLNHVTMKHTNTFSEEFNPTWANVTITVDNTGPNRFDGSATTDYSLLPNDGKTCAFNDCAQVHTGLGFAGSNVAFTGVSTVEFVNGGAGLAIGPGARRAGADPCLTSRPDLCPAVDYGKRGSFTFGDLTLRGSGLFANDGPMGGLACAESDCIGNKLTVQLGDDPNAQDQNLRLVRGGVGCAADEGVRIGWNPVTNGFLANVPLDPTCALGGPGCVPCTVGDGTCIPKALSNPGTTGVCKLAVDEMHLTAQTDLALPQGPGVVCAMKSGRCDVGGMTAAATGCIPSAPVSFPASTIDNFEEGIAVAGGANVDPATGVPRAHSVAASLADTLPDNDGMAPIPSMRACIRNVKINNSELAIGMGGDMDATMDAITADACQYNCVHVANPTANIATVANSACPSYDGIHCKDRGRDYEAANIGIGEEDHLAAIAGGVTAAQKLHISNSRIGCNSANLNNSGLEPVLPDIGMSGPTGALTCAGTNASLTFLGAIACGLNPAVGTQKGADVILYGNELMDIQIPDSNVCVASPGVYCDNVDNTTSSCFVTADQTCWLKPDGTCITSSTPNEIIVAVNVPGDTGAVSTNTSLEGTASSTTSVTAGSDTDGDGLSDATEAALPSLPPGTDPNSCSGKFTLARTIVTDANAQGLVSPGIKAAVTGHVDKAQASSGGANNKRCLAMLDSAEKVAAGKISNGSLQGLELQTLESAESCCAAH